MYKQKIIIVKFSYTMIRHIYEKIIEMNKYYDIHLVTLDTTHNREIFENKIHKIYYVPTVNLKSKIRYLIDKIKFIVCIVKKIWLIKPELIVVHIFKGDLLLPLLMPANHYVLQFYHFEVGTCRIKRYINNIRKFLDIMIYKDVVYNHDVMPQWILNIKKNIKYIPGSFSRLSSLYKDFSNLNLLYVGTLTNRNIHETVEGLSLFIKNSRCKQIKYHIIGDGKNQYKDLIKDKIKKCGVEKNVIYHGRISDDDLGHYFDICNVGISYVPITSYFTNNIPTKTYEYLIAGMAVLATATSANKDVIDQNNGVIIQDNPESFYKGMIEIYNHKDKYDSSNIISKVKKYSNELVVKNYYVPYFSELIEKNFNR